MPEKYYSILTNRGKALEAESAASGKPVILKDFVIGDGNGQAVMPDPANTTLVHEVYRGAISSLAVSPEQDNQFIAQLVLPADIGGFTVREVGLLTDSGELYAVGNCAAIEKPESGVSVRLQFRLAVNETSDIELKVATGDGLFLRQDANLNDVNNKAESRKNLGLGSSAIKDTGTSGDKVPVLNVSNTWGAKQSINNSSNATTDVTLDISGVQHTPLVLRRPSANANLSIGFQLQGMSTKRLGINLEGDLCYGEQENQGANPRIITQSILDNKGLTVGGITLLKGNTTVAKLTATGSLANTSEEYVIKSGVGPVANNSRFTRGYRIAGVNNTSADLGFTEQIGQYYALSFHVVGAVNDKWFEFRDNGDAVIQGDIQGPLWNGSLSNYIGNMRNQVNKSTSGWFKDSVTGFITQWGTISGVSGTDITFPIAFPNSCTAVAASDSGVAAWATGASNRSRWGFKLQSNSAGSVTATYIAVGY